MVLNLQVVTIWSSVQEYPLKSSQFKFEMVFSRSGKPAFAPVSCHDLNWIQFRFEVRDGIQVFGKAHMRSVPPVSRTPIPTATPQLTLPLKQNKTKSSGSDRPRWPLFWALPLISWAVENVNVARTPTILLMSVGSEIGNIRISRSTLTSQHKDWFFFQREP